MSDPANALRRSPRRRAFVMVFVIVGAFAVGLFGTRAVAQYPVRGASERYREVGYVALQQAVRDAASDNVALIIASHPDDRYVLPAAYLRFDLGMRVAVLLMTRGKGGQNNLGPETGDALGVLRTFEAEQCAAHLGAKVYYLNRPDNGYSRSAAETLSDWGETRTVEDLARLIRKIKPDLVMTTHHIAESHGHDLALLRVLPKAVQLSGDPKFETAGLPPFVVSRLFRGASPSEEDDATVSMSMGHSDAARGKTYRELAYEALQENRTQSPLQPMATLLQTIVEMVPVKIGDQPLRRTLLDRLPNLFSVLPQAIPDFDHRKLNKGDFDNLTNHLGSLPELSSSAIQLQKKLRAIPAAAGSELARRLRIRMAAVERVILQSAGVRVFMKVPPGVEAAPGEDMPLQIWIGNEGHHNVTGIEVTATSGGKLRLDGPRRNKTELESQESVALEAFYRPPNLSDEDRRRIFTRDTFESPLRVRFRFRIDGQPITIEEFIPTGLQPAVKVSITPDKLLIPNNATSVPFVVTIERKARKRLNLRLRIKTPAGMRVENGVQDVTMARNERFREFTFMLKAPHVGTSVSAMHVHLGDDVVRANVHRVDVQVSDELRVGLVPGVDNTTYEVLRSLIGESRLEKFEPGLTLPILDQSRLHTIVVDVRALQNPKARSGFARLLEFVKAGGRLVVFYHKDKEFNIGDVFFRGAPYPLEIGKGRVTQQDAPVRVLKKDHVLFNYPNKILPRDWDGWKQERGLYFPKTYDARYTELLEMHDPGLPPERGALLYVRHGKGDYIYCALSLYRQLKNRHAGACRLFANMISPRRSAD
jgi:LmbE family N-acetylglucosaminyl deacetylase